LQEDEKLLKKGPHAQPISSVTYELLLTLVNCFHNKAQRVAERSFWRIAQKKKDRAGTVFEDGIGVRKRALG